MFARSLKLKAAGGRELELVFVRRDVQCVQYSTMQYACTEGPRGHRARLRSSQYKICFLPERADKKTTQKNYLIDILLIS